MTDTYSTILLSIPSYREYELENTVKEFYNKAKYRHRIKFAIVSQSDDHPEFDFIAPDQLRYLKIHYNDTYGICWVRSIAARMFNDYDFYFQIDGHMFPEQDWDEKIINKYLKAKEKHGDKIVLTTIPARYTLNTKTNTRTKMPELHQYSDVRGIYPRQWGKIKEFTEDLQEIFYIQGACMFSEGSLIDIVQIDPEIHYFAEEITYSIRCFAHGYKIIGFMSPIFYHLFAADRHESGVFKNPWSDKHARLNLIDNETRANIFFNGELHGKMGVSEEDLIAYCNKTGYVIPGISDKK